MPTDSTAALPKTPTRRRSPRIKSSLATFIEQNASPIRSPPHKKKLSQSASGSLKVTPKVKGNKPAESKKHKKPVPTTKEVDHLMSDPDKPKEVTTIVPDDTTAEDLEKAKKYKAKKSKATKAKATKELEEKQELARRKKAEKQEAKRKEKEEAKKLKDELDALEAKKLEEEAKASTAAKAKAAKDAKKLKEKDEETDDDSVDEDSDDDLTDRENGNEETDNDDDEDEDDKDAPTTYASAAAEGATLNDDQTAPVVNDGTYQSYRAKLTLVIPKPKSKEQRLKFLMEVAGKIMKAGRKLEPNLFLRRFQEVKRLSTSEKNEWIQKFKPSDSSANNFVAYFAQGLFSWLPIAKTEFTFRVQFVLPESTNIPTFIDNFEHVLPEGCKLRKTLSQKIYAPYKIGSLLRSTEKMTSSSDFIDEVNRRAALINPKVVFGMSFGTIAHPNGNKKDWKKAPRAIILETNRDIVREATVVAFKLFPAKRKESHKAIWGMNLVFFYDTKHEECANLPSVQNDIAILINRQKVHHKMEMKVAHNHFIPHTIDDPVWNDDPETLRELLMNIKSKTTRGSVGLNLFTSICFSEWAGTKSYWFHFHRCVKTEAESVVRALPIMLKCEYGIDPDFYFLETATDGDETWDAETRCLENAVTLAMAAAVDGCGDLRGDDSDDGIELEINEDDNITLRTLEERERQRLMGGDDDETHIDRSSKKKKVNKSKSKKTIQQVEVINIDDNNSTGNSTIGMGSARSEKRISAQRQVLSEAGNMIQQNEEQRKEKDKERDAKTSTLEAALAQSQAQVEELKAMFLQQFSVGAQQGPPKPPSSRNPHPVTPAYEPPSNETDDHYDFNAGGDQDEMELKAQEEDAERERLARQEEHKATFMKEVDELMGGDTIPPNIYDSNGNPTSQGLDPIYQHLSPDPDHNMNPTHAPNYEGESDVDSSETSQEEVHEDGSSSSGSSDDDNDDTEYGNDHGSTERDDQSSYRSDSAPASIASNLSSNRDTHEDGISHTDSDLVQSIRQISNRGVTSNPLHSTQKNLDKSFQTHDPTATGGEPGQKT